MAGKLILMMGIQGSGKSTYAKEKMSDESKYVIVSRDEIRKKFGNDKYFSREKEKFVFEEYIKQIINGLNQNKIVCADATQLTRKTRANVIGRIPKSLYTDVSVIWVKVPVAVALDRNEKRRGTDGYIDPHVIVEFSETVMEPTKTEGISKVMIVNEYEQTEVKIL